MTKCSLGLIVIASIVFGCNSKTNTNDSSDQKDSIGSDAIVSHNKQDSLWSNGKQLITGLWATSVDANASFRVKGDSLYFFEDPDPVFFEIKEDSFIYYLEGEKYFNKILKLNSDSIVFVENNQLIRLYNRDN